MAPLAVDASGMDLAPDVADGRDPAVLPLRTPLIAKINWEWTTNSHDPPRIPSWPSGDTPAAGRHARGSTHHYFKH